ncbi:PadR family transcriptional regulator [Pseudonocardia nantongensis]|uniref:PadR family transcriptional regulator n=1 Tax=Pseudonocardia nantongensis TaxID=1181885 RepID=UPI00397D95D5
MRVRDRATLDLLILAAVHDEPGDGAAVAGLVRERSGGVVELGPGTVHRALHRLERNRLVHRPPGTTGYRLRPSGTRVLRRRRRDFEQWVDVVKAVLPAGGDDRGR